jgi:hypothetical protein
MITLPSRFVPAAAGVCSAAVWCAFGLLAVSTPSLRAQSPVFSEDFESGSLNKAVWKTLDAGKAVITVQQTQVAHGKSAVQIHYPAGEKSFAFIVASHLPDSVRTHFFGRAYVFISPTVPIGHDVLLNAGTPGYPISNFLEIGASRGKNIMVSYQQNAADIPRNETTLPGIAYPLGRWFCLEWEFQDHPDRVTAWIDGEPAADLKDFVVKPRAPRAQKADPNAKADPAAAPVAPVAPVAAAPAQPVVPGTDLVKGFSDFAFGFHAWGAGAKDDFDIYYDDIAIDTKRIGPVK